MDEYLLILPNKLFLATFYVTCLPENLFEILVAIFHYEARIIFKQASIFV